MIAEKKVKRAGRGRGGIAAIFSRAPVLPLAAAVMLAFADARAQDLPAKITTLTVPAAASDSFSVAWEIPAETLRETNPYAIRWRVKNPLGDWLTGRSGAALNPGAQNQMQCETHTELSRTSWPGGCLYQVLAADSSLLISGGVFEVQVRAFNDAGGGAWSNLVEYAREGVVAAAPAEAPVVTDLVAKAGALRLTWTAPAGTITDYRVRWRSADPDGGGALSAGMWQGWVSDENHEISIGDSDAGISIGGVATAYTIPDLRDDTAYDVAVSAVNEASIGAWGAAAESVTPNPLSAEAALIALSISASDGANPALFPVFDGAHTEYGVGVDGGGTSANHTLTFTPTLPPGANFSGTVGGDPASATLSGANGGIIMFNRSEIGSVIYQLSVTAENGAIQKTYTFTIIRGPDVSAISVRNADAHIRLDIPLAQNFNRNLLHYTAGSDDSNTTVLYPVDRVDVKTTWTTDGANAGIGRTDLPKTPIRKDGYATVNLEIGKNEMEVVFGNGGANKDLVRYSITIIRADTTGALRTLTAVAAGAGEDGGDYAYTLTPINPPQIPPLFHSEHKTYQSSAPVSNSIGIVATTVGGGEYSAGIDGGGTFTANSGETAAVTVTRNQPVTVNVTAANQTYAIEFSEISAAAELNALAISSGALTPKFAADTFTYSADVFHATTTITLTAAAHPGASIAVKTGMQPPTIAQSGMLNLAQSLAIGATAINLEITAQDAATILTYTINLIRPPTPRILGTTGTPRGSPDIDSSGIITGIDVNWIAAAGILDATYPYRLRYRIKNPLTAWLPNATGKSVADSSIKLRDENLFAHQRIHQIQTRAVNDDGAGSWSALGEIAASAFARATAPGVPGDLTLDLTTPGEIGVNWSDATATVTDYRVRWRLAATTADAGAWQGWVSDAAGEISIGDSDFGVNTGSVIPGYTIAVADNSVAYNIQVIAVNKSSLSGGDTAPNWSQTANTVAGSDARLLGLGLSGDTGEIPLGRDFAADVLTYTAFSRAANTAVIVTLRTAATDAEVQIQTGAGDVISLPSDTASAPQTLAVGENTLRITVTAGNGADMQTYAVIITREDPATPPRKLPPPVLAQEPGGFQPLATSTPGGIYVMFNVPIDSIDADFPYRLRWRVKTPFGEWQPADAGESASGGGLSGGISCASAGLTADCRQIFIRQNAMPAMSAMPGEILAKLIPSAVYQAQIGAVNANGMSPWSDIAEWKLSGEPPPKPPPPANFRIIGGGEDDMREVTWSPPPMTMPGEITDYSVRWRIAAVGATGAGNWQGSISAPDGKISIGDADTGIFTGGVTTYTITNLRRNTPYDIETAAINVVRIGEWARETPRRTALDVDADSEVSNIDGLLVHRYLRGIRAAELTEDLISPITAAQIAAIEARIAAEIAEMTLDVTADGAVNAADGKLISDYLSGIRGGGGFTAEVTARMEALLGGASVLDRRRMTLDLDADNQVNFYDGLLTAQYLAGMRIRADIDSRIAAIADVETLDINGDGEVGVADGILIARYLLGVTEGGGLTRGQADSQMEGEVTEKIRELLPAAQ